MSEEWDQEERLNRRMGTYKASPVISWIVGIAWLVGRIVAPLVPNLQARLEFLDYVRAGIVICTIGIVGVLMTMALAIYLHSTPFEYLINP